MHKRISLSDYTITPVTVRKQWSFEDYADELSHTYAHKLDTLFVAATDEITENGVYTRLLHKMIEQRFYSDKGEWIRQTEHSPRIVQDLGDLARVISIPTLIHGEGIVRETVRIIDNLTNAVYVDDAEGNLVTEESLNTDMPVYIGNVFYTSGIVVVTDTTYLVDTFTINFTGTHTVYEHEILCQVSEGDFNVSTNPTVCILDPVTGEATEAVKPFALKRAFSPYITTVGLYDDDGDLVAISRLARPARKEVGMPMVFSIRIDT